MKTVFNSRILLAFAAVCASTSVARGQTSGRISFALDVQDDSIGGVISSVLRGALRSLGDVEVVTPAERPDFVLEGVVLCSPTCATWQSVSGAFRLYSRVTEDIVRMALQTSGIRAADTTVRRMAGVLSRAEFSRQSWVVTWGRQRYEAAAREFVGGIDSQCLEPLRMDRRLASANTAEARKELLDAIIRRKPTC